MSSRSWDWLRFLNPVSGLVGVFAFGGSNRTFVAVHERLFHNDCPSIDGIKLFRFPSIFTDVPIGWKNAGAQYTDDMAGQEVL